MENSTNQPTIFFRDHSDFCNEIRNELKKHSIFFIEVISDSVNNEIPCIVSPDFAVAFNGEVGVRKFLSLVLNKSVQQIEAFV